MSEINVAAVVRKLIGPIEPVGEAHTDDKRFENLVAMVQLLDGLLFEVHSVTSNKDREEFSMKRAGEYADKWLANVKEPHDAN